MEQQACHYRNIPQYNSGLVYQANYTNVQDTKKIRNYFYIEQNLNFRCVMLPRKMQKNTL